MKTAMKAKLSDVCEIIAGQSPPSSTYNTNGTGLPFYQGKADFGDLYPQTRMWCSEPQKIAESNDILISVRAPVGPTNLCRERSCIGRGLSAIRCRGGIDTKYLLFYLRLIENRWQSAYRGSTFSAITQNDIKTLEVPLPPLSEQKRISAILNQADAIHKKRRQAIDELNTLIPAIFYDMFGDPFGRSGRWTMKPICELGNIVTGSTPPAKLDGMFGGEIPFMTPGDLENLQSCERSLTKAGAEQSRVVRASSTLVCCIGATIGKTDMISTASAFNQQINAIEWGQKIDDYYGFYVMSLSRSNVINAAIKTTLPILKKSAFALLKIPVPAITFQREFSRKVHAVMSQHQHQCQAEAEADDLFNSLVQRAFKGEL